jgi:outer membrane protein TolC
MLSVKGHRALFRLMGIAAFFSILSPTALSAQPVTLEDVVRAVMTESPAVRLEDERVRRAEGQLQQAQGAFDWNATAESGWERLYVAESQNGFLVNELQEVDAWRTTIGIGRQFRNGISVQPGISFYSRTDASAAQTQGLTKPLPAINLSIPLMRGLGEDSMAATTERAAQLGVDASMHGRTFGTQQALTNAVITFWRCLALHDQLEIAEADQQSADAYVDTLEAFVANGQSEPAALDRARASQAVQRVTLSGARGADEACRRSLDVAMGGAGSGDPPVPVGDFPQMEGVSALHLNAANLSDNALTRRADVRALSLQSAAQAERVRGAEDGMQPQLNVLVDTRRVLLRLSQSLGRSAQQGQLSEARAGEGEARINLHQLENQVRLDIADRLRSVNDALANWTALSSSADAMARVADDTGRRFDAGIATREEYRTVEEEAAAVRRQLIEIQYQYASSLGGLRLASGNVEAGDAMPVEAIAEQFRTLPAN